MRERDIRIGNVSGFFGDRQQALAEMVRHGDVDVITGDYLAEVTMSVLWKLRRRDPEAGYAATFPAQLAPVLGEVAEAGIKVVVNAGGLNPAGLATRLRAMVDEAGLDLTVAHVEGDDLAPHLNQLLADGHTLANTATGEPLAEVRDELLTANAYLGGWGIAAALQAGADIVVCPRVADASLVVGAAAWWHGWDRDDLDALAGALVAGHVIECGPQAAGGNFSGFHDIDGLVRPGFPIAEVAADGSSVITKPAGTGGAITVDTVTAQLLYEIQGPDYLNADVTARFDSIRLEETAPDRVRISGVRGGPPPTTTKVAATVTGDHRNELTFVLTGLDIAAKAAVLEAAVRDRLEGRVATLEFQRIGIPAEDADTQDAASCLLRVVATDPDERRVGRAFSGALVELALANYPGLYPTGLPGGATTTTRYWPASIAQDAVDHVVVHADGTREPIAPTPGVAEPTHVRARPEPPVPDDAIETVRVPLGRLVHARSGDKGGTANVGLWTRDRAVHDWLATVMTPAMVRHLLPEAAGLDVEVHLLPNLSACNVLVHGLLGAGATASVRFDAQAKGLGEYLRSRHVDVPAELVDATA